METRRAKLEVEEARIAAEREEVNEESRLIGEKRAGYNAGGAATDGADKAEEVGDWEQMGVDEAKSERGGGSG